MEQLEATPADVEAYAQKLLGAVAARFGVPYSLIAADYERCNAAQLFAQARAITDRTGGPIGHIRAMVALSLRHTEYDEMWRDAYALGRGQWG